MNKDVRISVIMWLLGSGKKGSGPSKFVHLFGACYSVVFPSSFSCPPRVMSPVMYHLFKFPEDVKTLRMLAKLLMPEDNKDQR